MDLFLKTKYTNIVSLGSNCYPKLFIQRVIKPTNGETQLFDYIGTSVWSINALLRADFKDLTNVSMTPILDKVRPIVTNTEYYVRFMHELRNASDAEKPAFKEQIERRIQRFTALMSEPTNNILFIRWQENPKGRIAYPNFPTTTEYEELGTFVALVKEKYGAAVTVIYINTEQEGWNEARNILSVKISSLAVDVRIAATRIKALFETNKIVDSLSGV